MDGAQFSLRALLALISVLALLFAAAGGWFGPMLQAVAWVWLGLPIAYAPFAFLRAVLYLTRRWI